MTWRARQMSGELEEWERLRNQRFVRRMERKLMAKQQGRYQARK